MKLLNKFKLTYEKEDFKSVRETIENGVEFKGTNLWILIFAVFIASLGLNVNSTAVIIGAMLVSPLMGPILGMGFGMAVNDLLVLRRSISSYLYAAGVGLATSTVFFLISPINEARSEIFARTSPNIYDVLIAFFGGLAGMLATCSKLKGNVIPGVAIATALVPPLCTAGFGVANAKPEFFFGALYLFLINTVFIALATLITVRLLKFPFKHLPKEEDEKREKRIVYTIVAITILPSLYFGYDLVQQNRFTENAARFIQTEARFPNDYLLNREIDAKNKTITLVFGGAPIESKQIEALRAKLPSFELNQTKLEVRQGFAYIQGQKEDNKFSMVLSEKQQQIQALQNRLDSIARQDTLSHQVFREMKAQYPEIQTLALQPVWIDADESRKLSWLAVIQSKKRWTAAEKAKMEAWLKVRLNINTLALYFE